MAAEEEGNVDVRQIAVEIVIEEDEHHVGGNVTDYMELVGSPRSRRSVSVDVEAIQRPVDSKIKERWYKSFIPPEPIRSSFYPPKSTKEWKYFLFIHFPILGWLWNYQFKDLIGDIISGIIVAVMHIPQGLAYGQLAGLPPVYGLYGSFVPVIIYSFFGTSKHASVGTFAVVSLMVYNAINRVFEGNEELFPCLNDNNETINELSVNVGDINTTCGEIKVDIALTLAFVSGILMFVLGILKFGFITILLSEPLISGYTTGAAVHVFTSQVRHIFGLQIPSIRGLFSIPKTWIEVFKNIPSTNIATLVISVMAVAVLITFRVINRKVLRQLKVSCWLYSSEKKECGKRKIQWPIPLPSQLIVVVIATGISYAASLQSRFDVNIVEYIPTGLPDFTPPKTSYMVTVIQDAAIISVVSFAIGVSVAKVFAKEFNYTISPNQELVAYGITNIIGSLFGSLNAAVGLSRSTVQASSGGKTQLVGFISSFIILLVLVVLGSLFEPLPNAVLASIIWVALYGLFSQVRDVWRYFKLSIADMLTWVVVFVATVFLGVDLGLGVGVMFSLLTIIWKIILPKSAKLAKTTTNVYCDIDHVEAVESHPGIVIYRFQAPLCFINCEVFQERLDIVCDIDRNSLTDSETPGCIQVLFNKIMSLIFKNKGFDSPSKNQPNNSSTTSIETLILDCSPISFMDAVGVKVIQQIVLDFDDYGIQVLFAALTKNNRDMLERVGFFEKCGRDWLFRTVKDAVIHAKHGVKLHPASEEKTIDVVNDDNEGEQQTHQV